MRLVLTLLFFIFLVSCHTNKYAKVEYFPVHFSVLDIDKNLKNLILDSLNADWDYTMTNESAEIFPYYIAIKRGTPFERDKIMLPHSTLHRVIPLDDTIEIIEGGKKLSLELEMTNDSIVYLSTKSMIYRNNNWEHLVNGGAFRYNKEKMAIEEIRDEIMFHIILNTFK